MSQSRKIMFCQSCQTEVEAIMMPYGSGGEIKPRCTLCGSVIEEIGSEFSDTCEGDPSISLDEVSFVDESISIPSLDEVLVVGYPPGVRDLVTDKIIERRLAREVVACQNGEEMIVKAIESLHADSGNGQIDLVVSDVPMPFLNGINAMIGLRAIERSYQDHDLIPILFLTNKTCDETFKKVIKYVAPAKYATLGPVDDREKFIKHLLRVISLVGQEKW